MLNTYLSEFSVTWNTFIRIPLPHFLRGSGSDLPQTDGHPQMMRPLMPWIGTVLGILLAVPLWGLSLLPGGRLSAGLAGTVIAPLVLELMTSWNGINSLSSYFDLRRQGATHAEAFMAVPESINKVRPAASLITLMTIYILRMILLGVLAVFAPFWIIVSLTCSWMVRAELASLNRIDDFGRAWLSAPVNLEKRHYIFALAAIILFGLFHLFPALLAFFVAWGIAWIASNLCLETISGINRQSLETFGYTAEIMLLFLGVLIYAAA